MAATSRRFRAVFLAGTLLLAAAPPALAQGFSFSFGSGPDRFTRHHRMICLTDSQLRRSIVERGYRDVYLNVPIDNRIQIRATRGSWVYLLRVNACTGRILGRERLRPA